jgi:Secretion system C-terminal sorting domain
MDCGKADSTVALSVFENVNANDGIVLLPNPFSTQTVLKVSEDLRNATVTLYNSFGHEVRQVKNVSGNSITLYRDNLPGGLYFLCIMQGERIFATGNLVITD